MFDEGASSEALNSWGHLAQDWLINNMGGAGGGASAFGEGQTGQATEPGWGLGQGGAPALGCLSLALPWSLAWLALLQPAAQRLSVAQSDLGGSLGDPDHLEHLSSEQQNDRGGIRMLLK